MLRNFRLIMIFFSGFVLLSCGQQASENFDLETAKQKWAVAGVAWTEADLILLESGETIYSSKCSVCHAREGTGDIQLGTPALDGSPYASGLKSDLVKRILIGKKGTAMPAFADALSDRQVAAVASYLRNAWDNQSMDTVSSEEVAKLR